LNEALASYKAGVPVTLKADPIEQAKADERERIGRYVVDALGVEEWEMIQELMKHGQHDE
jgi:hypothetical protein